MNRTLESSPDFPVHEGKVLFGVFNKAFKTNNFLQAKAFGIVSKTINYMRLKEWQAFQMGNERYFVFIAIYNAKNLGVNQFFIYDKQEKKKYSYEKLVPFFKLKIAQNVWDDYSEFRSRNFKLKVENHFDKQNLTVEVAVKQHATLPELSGRLSMNFTTHTTQPVVVSLPFAKNRGMYSLKQIMPLSGKIQLGSRQITFQPSDSFAIFDDHKGFYPYAMKYDWGTAAQVQANGKLLGFNFTRNQALQPEQYNENALWDGSQVHLLPPVTFQRTNGVMNDWLIKDQFGLVNLTFTPETDNVVKINAGILRSDYHGPYGHFSGYIQTPLKTFEFQRIFGMGEQKQIWA